ncbi:MAG: hypothetical protein LC793_07870 [Thermomicrobia bacterium]|nr:hypothetical protein [Thermomicrobia bacterium]
MRVQGRSRRFRRHTAWSFLAVPALLGAVMMAWVAAPASAATAFANPAFAAQWQAGEAITPNFWGPLALAQDGRNEPYVEGKLADGTSGQRLVQYFDKARMELTNPSTGVVTNGLLAKELITGQLQTGDNTFETRQPAGVPVAGDPDNIGPTYASINMNATTLLANTPSAAGSPTTRLLGGTGTLGIYTGAYASDPQGTITAYDADTQHNVPAAFSAYRTKAGLLTIGFAISEALLHLALPVTADADHPNGLRHRDAVRYHDSNHRRGYDRTEAFPGRCACHDAKLLHGDVADE